MRDSKTNLPQLPAEILDPNLPSKTSVRTWTTFRSRSTTTDQSRKGALKPFRDWAGKTFEEIVKGALELNGLTIRAASELTGLPYARFTSKQLQGSPARAQTLHRMAPGLKLPLDVLYVRNGRLPPGSEGDLEFQDVVVRLWRNTRRRS